MNGFLGIINSELIRTYIKCDQRYHKIGYFIKCWTKHWNLVGASNGFLSSYAWQILIIYFLQKGLEVPVLPNLQDFDSEIHKHIVHYEPRIKTSEVYQTNCYFRKDVEQVMTELYDKHGRNEMSTAELIYKFFEFYSSTFTKDQIISIKDSDLKTKSSPDHLAFSIVDPFQVEFDPGHTLKSHST